MKITKKSGKIYSVKTKSRSATKKPKTIKVAINKDFGGFSLSPKGVEMLASNKGKLCYFFTRDVVHGNVVYTPIEGYPDGLFWVASSSKTLTTKNYSDVVLQSTPDNRSDPDLIDVIEKLGREANGKYAEIKIVEIPADVKWQIGEYDGMEHVEEEHREWH